MKPSGIVDRLSRQYGEEYPDGTPGINTVKQWVKRLRPLGLDSPWDFDKATPEERRLLAPLFTTRQNPMTGIWTSDWPWPSARVASWIIRIRQLEPNALLDSVHESALRLAHYDQSIADDTASEADRAERERELRWWLTRCGKRLLPEHERGETVDVEA